MDHAGKMVFGFSDGVAGLGQLIWLWFIILRRETKTWRQTALDGGYGR